MALLRLPILSLAVAVSACTSTTERLQSSTPASADSTARQLIASVVGGDLGSAEAILDYDIRGDETLAILSSITDTLNDRTVGEFQLIRSHWSKQQGGEYRTLLYEAPLDRDRLASLTEGVPSRLWLLADVRLRNSAVGYRISSFNTNISGRPLREVNGFADNLGIPQLLWLFFIVASVGTVLVAVVLVLRTPIPRRWLWVFVSLLGVTHGTMNWTTGAVSFQPFSVLLFATAIQRPGVFGPWMISWAFPAGAFWALNVVRARRAELARSRPTDENGRSSATSHSA